MSVPHWNIFRDAAEVADAAAEIIGEMARHAIEQRGLFSLVLAGGNTPAHTYRLLARQEQDWSRWAFFYSDERCLPRFHPDRNSAMARAMLLDRIPLDEHQVHEIPAELGPEQGALKYEPVVRNSLPFDLVLLGLGEDGHTASLFPGQRHPDNRLVVPVRDAPKPPAERVSLNIPALANCRGLLFLVTGESKRAALADWRRGKSIPASRIHPARRPEVLVDEAAWGE
ncbi:MAG TPA: 6-phosphogluconolactonase [Chromatiaceae bacterium]|nr:6-phosphogluconolactonase [Chromatiaceae bacterium]